MNGWIGNDFASRGYNIAFNCVFFGTTERFVFSSESVKRPFLMVALHARGLNESLYVVHSRLTCLSR